MDEFNQQPESEISRESSVLSRVMAESHDKELKDLAPSRTVGNILSKIKDRERDVLTARYGLSANRTDKETLESIGKKFSITRERVRQIEKSALQKISKKYWGSLKPLVKLVDEYMSNNGGVADIEGLSKFLAFDSDNAELEQNAVRLVMSANKEVEPLKKQANLREGWVVKGINVDELSKVYDQAERILKQAGEPIKQTDLINKLKNQFAQVGSGAILGALNISNKLAVDHKGNWGLSDWPGVVPKRVRDKIFVVMEQAGKPLHFGDIAKLIQEKFHKGKSVLSRTVHNELISDKRFVLVGRGIYALTAWGYAPGVVSDVIKEALVKAGKPLSVNEIIEEVLKRRKVKRNTVVANLQNRALFKKTAKATYDLA